PPRQPHLRLRVRPGQVLVLRGKDRPLPAVRRGADPVVAPQGAGTGPGGGGGPAAPSGGGAQPGAGAAAVPRGGLAGGRYPLSPPPRRVRIRARRGVQPVLRRLPRPVRARRRPPGELADAVPAHPRHVGPFAIPARDRGARAHVTMAVSIRPAEARDAEVIAGFTQNTFSWGDYVADAFLDWLADEDAAVPVATDDHDRPIALARVRMLSDRESWLSAARVHPDHRRKGLGSALNDWCVEWSRQRGAAVARLEIETWNEPAQNQVRRLGYRHVATVVDAHREAGRAEIEPATNGGRRTPAEERLGGALGERAGDRRRTANPGRGAPGAGASSGGGRSLHRLVDLGPGAGVPRPLLAGAVGVAADDGRRRVLLPHLVLPLRVDHGRGRRRRAVREMAGVGAGGRQAPGAGNGRPRRRQRLQVRAHRGAVSSLDGRGVAGERAGAPRVLHL